MRLISERPFWRMAVRLKARLIHGRRMAHAQDWLPHLSLTPAKDDATGQVLYKNREIARLLPFENFRDRVGDACVIVGSGPSLRTQRLDRLAGDSCILLNGAICLSPDRIAKPLAVAIEDERFVWRHLEMMRKHIGNDTLCLFSVAALRAVAEQDATWLQGRPIFLIDNLLKPYSRHRLELDSPELRDFLIHKNGVAISTSPADGVVPAGSIAVTALQWAMAAHPKRIGFAGVDISNAAELRFYETADDRARSRLAAARARILGPIALAAELCESMQIQLETYSRTSALRELNMPYSSRLDEVEDAA